MSLLQISGLTVSYENGNVVENVSLDVNRGESVALVGESGSGKSQTALAMLGLLPRSAKASGSISIDGEELLGASERRLNQVRALRIGMVFQDPLKALNPHCTIGEFLLRILVSHKLKTKRKARTAALSIIEKVGLSNPHRIFQSYPHELSGGMCQRALIAAAMITEPELIVADEPTTALDVTVQAQILRLLDDLLGDTALLLITHDLGVVAGRCERMVVLSEGRMVESGSTRSTFSAPKHDATRLLIEAARSEELVLANKLEDKAPVIEIENASVRYQAKTNLQLEAVQDVSLSLAEGQTLAVVGESGSGKSSLVRAALGLVSMNSGRVVVFGESIGRNIESHSSDVRRNVQFIFQNPASSLNPQMIVSEIIGEQLEIHEPNVHAETRGELVVKALQMVGLESEKAERHPHQLSGGEAQRVALARALILRPKVLICDEATASLDSMVRKQILSLLVETQHEIGMSIIFISHDLDAVKAISHNIMVMYLGKVVELARTDSLYNNPMHPYSRALIDAIPRADPEDPGGASSLTGEIPAIGNRPKGCVFSTRCKYRIDRCESESPAEREIGERKIACHRAEEFQR